MCISLHVGVMRTKANWMGVCVKAYMCLWRKQYLGPRSFQCFYFLNDSKIINFLFLNVF